MVAEDIFGKQLKIGDYIAFPCFSTIEICKVLSFGKGRYPKTKLSCEFIIGSKWRGGEYTWKKIGGLEDLKNHNSYYYRSIGDFIILDLPDNPVDETKLINRVKLIKDATKEKTQ
jgi:hypothetical protein